MSDPPGIRELEDLAASPAMFHHMMLRDWFAGQALIALSRAELDNVNDAEVASLVTDAYWIADAMMAQRNIES